MISLISYRQAIIDTLATAFGSLVRSVKAHRGQFESLGEIQQIATQSPAVLVAFREVQDIERQNGQVMATVFWVAYVLTRDKAGQPRDVLADAVLQILMQQVPGNAWGLEAVRLDDPEQIRARNLSSLAIDKAGSALWALTWQQKMGWPEVDIADLDDFLRYHADHIDANDPANVIASDDVELPQ